MKQYKLWILTGSLIILFSSLSTSLIAGGGGGGGLPPNGTSLSCGNTNTFNVSASGYTGGDPTSGDGGCNPCCYAGSDLDNDGLQDVPFSVENSQWFQFCNTSGSSMTVDIVVDEPGGGAGCNLQGAVWTGASIDATTIDCGNAGYQQFDSNPGGAADGFSFSVVIPAGQCAFIMVDGYAGTTCSGVGITVNCPCTGPTISVAASPNPICAGSSSTLTASCSANCTGISYSWSPGTGLSATTGASVTSTATTTTTYTVTGTTTGGCTGTASVTLTVNPVATANAGTDQNICFGNAATLAGSVGGGASTGTWTVSPAGGTFTPNATTLTATYSPAVAGTYTLTLTTNDPAGPCPAVTDQVVIVFGVPATVNANIDQSVCQGGSITLNGSFGGSASGASWSAGTGSFSPNASTMNATYTPSITSGTVNLTLTTNDPTGACPAVSDIMVVTVNPSPNANAGPDQVLTCLATTVVLNGSSTSSPVSFLWSGPAGGINSGGTTANPVVDVAGNYTVTITNTSTLCTATDVVAVTTNTTPPNANAGPDQVLTCTATTVILNGSSSTGGATFSWAGPGTIINGTTANPTVNAIGTYTVTVTNPANGCTASSTVNVTQNIVAPNANAGTLQTLTCTNTSVNLNGSSSTGGATFSWAGPNVISGGSTATPTVGAIGTYTITVTDPSNGCTATSSVLVDQNIAVPNADAGSDQALTCALPTVVLSGSSSTPGAAFLWTGPSIVSGETTTTPTVNGTGTYTITVTDPTNGCTATDITVVTPDANIPNIDAGLDDTLTCTILQLDLNGSSSTPSISFSWAGPGIVIGAGTANPTVDAPGNYTLTVTNTINGCSAVDQVIVVLDDILPNANAGSPQTLTCISSTTILNGSSTTLDATYNWAGPGSITNGNTATPTVNSTGTFTVTITNPNNGCINTATTVVTLDNTPPDANAGSPGLLTCVISSIDLLGSSITPGANFDWTGPGTIINSTLPNPTVNAVGTYTVTITDPLNGCTNTSTVSVSLDNIQPDANAGSPQSLTCVDLTVNLAGSSITPGATFNWTGPGTIINATLSNPTVDAIGSYTVTVTDPLNGCTNTSTVLVSNNNLPPDVNAGGTQYLTCVIDQVILNGSSTTPGAIYNWSGAGIVSGGASANPTVNLAGTYMVEVTDPINGCTATDLVDVLIDDTIPTIDAGADATITCSNDTVYLNASSTIGLVSFVWTGVGIISGGGTSNPEINQTGIYTVTVTNTNNGCTATDIAEVLNDLATPNANAGPDQMLTCGANTIFLVGSSSTPSTEYLWNGPGILSGDSTLFPVINAAGTYILTVTNINNGCTFNDTVEVTSNITPPNVDAGLGIILTCADTVGNLNGSSSSSDIVFDWNGTGLLSGNDTNTPTINQPGMYYLTVTDSITNCSNTDSVLVLQNIIQPTINAGADTSIDCQNNNILINGLSPDNVSYNWSGPGIVSGGNTATPIVNQAGSYIVTVVSQVNGCLNTDTMTVIPSNAFTLNVVSQSDVSCFGGSDGAATVEAIGGESPFNYTWAPSGGNSPVATSLIAGIYTVSATDNNNCNDSILITILEPPLLQLALVDTITPECETGTGSIIVLANGGTPNYNYSWSDTSITGSTLANIFTGNYTSIVMDDNGCIDSLAIFLDCYVSLIVPQLISPNGDGQNDVWIVDGIDSYPNNKVQIFNRWGNEVYATNGYANDWGGSSNSDLSIGTGILPTGTYFFIIDLFGDGTKLISNYLEIQK